MKIGLDVFKVTFWMFVLYVMKMVGIVGAGNNRGILQKGWPNQLTPPNIHDFYYTIPQPKFTKPQHTNLPPTHLGHLQPENLLLHVVFKPTK